MFFIVKLRELPIIRPPSRRSKNGLIIKSVSTMRLNFTKKEYFGTEVVLFSNGLYSGSLQ